MKVYTCFPGGKAKALTMSYDDGKIFDERLVEIFNKNGIKGTFNLNFGLLGDESSRRIPRERIVDLYRGHEIASHSLTHPTIERCPMVEVVREMLEDRDGLEKLTGTIIRGHAYPNGSYNEEIKQLLRSLGFAYARVVEPVADFGLPTDPMEWHPTAHHDDPELMKRAEFFANFKKSQYLKLMYVWGHSYEFDNHDNWHVIEEFCEYMGGRDDIWYATNIEIIDYMDAAKRLLISADGERVYNPSAAGVWLQLNGEKCVEVPGGQGMDLNAVS